MSEPVLLFSSQKEWADWLETNHENSPAVWLRIAKKGSGLKSVSYAEALDAALCYGWIDGQRKAENGSTFLQRFIRRGKKSIWSKLNREKVLALINAGEMKAAGLREMERAQEDGRWDAAYDSFSRASVPPDFEAALEKNPRAKAFFATLNAGNRYAFLFRIQTAKKLETRQRRIAEFVAMLAKKEKFHP